MSEYRRNRVRIERELRGAPREEIEKTMAWQMARVNDQWFEAIARPWLRFVKRVRRGDSLGEREAE